MHVEARGLARWSGSWISVAVIEHTIQIQIGEGMVYLVYTSRSQVITEENECRNLRQGTWKKSTCYLVLWISHRLTLHCLIQSKTI